MVTYRTILGPLLLSQFGHALPSSPHSSATVRGDDIDFIPHDIRVAGMPNPDGAKAGSITILSNLDGDSLSKGECSLTANDIYGDVAPVWTQLTGNSNYTVILDTVEGVIESGINKNITFFEFPIEGEGEYRPNATGLETVTVFENYFPERIVYLKGSIAFGGEKI